jgi:hypothetical protein
MGNWAILQAIFFEPRKAFAELGERPRYWFPLLLLVIVTTAVSMWYLGIVDLRWMTEQQLRTNPLARSLTEEQIIQTASAASGRRGLQMIITGIATPFIYALILMFSGLLSLLAAKITNVKLGYRHWFTLACWTTMPTLLAQVAAAVMLAAATSAQIGQDDLQVLSLNSLVFHRKPADPGYTLLTYANLTYFWSIALSVVGVKQWSGRSWLFSFLFSTWLLLLVAVVWTAIKVF